MSNKIRKVIPALDETNLEKIKELLGKIVDQEIIYGYKIGFALGLTHGLPGVVDMIKSISDKPVIYDHQKAATDIPDTGRLFAKTLKNSGIDDVIFFPQAGPATMEAWIKAGQDEGLKVIVGGVMTHPKFIVSEGGFIRDDAVTEIYRSGYGFDVRDFVVPLTKPEITKKIYGEAGLDDSCTFYSPGFGRQGGEAARFAFLKNHYMIIGRSLLSADDPAEYLDAVKSELSEI